MTVQYLSDFIHFLHTHGGNEAQYVLNYGYLPKLGYVLHSGCRKFLYFYFEKKTNESTFDLSFGRLPAIRMANGQFLIWLQIEGGGATLLKIASQAPCSAHVHTLLLRWLILILWVLFIFILMQ